MVAHRVLLHIIICYNGNEVQTTFAQGCTGMLGLKLLARIGYNTCVYSRNSSLV